MNQKSEKDIVETTMQEDLCRTDGYKTSMSFIPDKRDPIDLRGRRVLVVANGANTATRTREALEMAGLAVQMYDADGHLHIEDCEGEPRLRQGEVLVVNGADIPHLEVQGMTHQRRAHEAIILTSMRAIRGAVDEHLILVSERDPLESVNNILNVMIDRITESDIARGFGGFDRIPEHISERLNWKPMLEQVEPSTRQPSNEAMNRLFGDAAMEREDRMRRTYVLMDEMPLRTVSMSQLPKRGFDVAAKNQAYNIHAGRTGRGPTGRKGRGGR